MLSCCIYCCQRFFFFKQKTAYEMRISDWSSDVCSSDLFGAHGHELVETDIDGEVDMRRVLHRLRKTAGDGLAHARVLLDTVRNAIVEQGPEIGRASCRERVGQTGRPRWAPDHQKKN